MNNYDNKLSKFLYFVIFVESVKQVTNYISIMIIVLLYGLFRSPEWNSISKEEKATMGLTFENDGEFW